MNESEPQFEKQPEPIEEAKVPPPSDGSPILEQLPGEEQGLRVSRAGRAANSYAGFVG
jgi:hypothetical protein